MAEHSMCQPGRPTPKSESHLASAGSSAFALFHRTKSSGSFLLPETPTRSPARNSSRLLPDSRPYSGKARTEKFTSPESSRYASLLFIRVWIMSCISATYSVARGSWSGRSIPKASASSCMAAMKRSVNERMLSPFSTARRIILSSMSVILRT